jgi:RNA polymerase sigma factor (sigma-70 family)
MARGDKAALAELYDRFSRPLYATALRIVNDPAEAQDIVHDAFIALWEKAAHLRHASAAAPSAWAVTLMRNRAIDRVRSRRRRSELLAAAAPDDLGYDETARPGRRRQRRRSATKPAPVRAAVAALPARTEARARARRLQRPHPAGNRRPTCRTARHREGPHSPRPPQTSRLAPAPAMIDERREELAALYALDLLEADERAAFEAELAADPAVGSARG